MRRARRLPDAPPALNLVPLLDMISLLVQVLLLHAHFGSLTQMSATAGFASGGGDEPPDRQQLDLTLDIAEGGFVAHWNEYGSVHQQALACTPPCTLPEQFPMDELGQLLWTIKRRHPSDDDLTIRPLHDVRFDVIARTMDTARQSSDGQALFPQTALLGSP